MTTPWQPPEPMQAPVPPVFQQPATPPAYQQPASPSPGYPQPVAPPAGYPQPGYPQPGYPQPGYPAHVVAPQQKSGTKTWVWVTVIVSVVVVLLAACAVAAWLGLAKLGELSREPYPIEPYPESSTEAPPTVGMHQIRMYVTGTGSAKLNWATSGSLYDNKTTTLPWSTVGTTRQDFVRSSVSVTGTGKMACQIEIDGTIRAKESGTGSVTCFFEGYI